MQNRRTAFPFSVPWYGSIPATPPAQLELRVVRALSLIVKVPPVTGSANHESIGCGERRKGKKT
jgi:hypothetical protein